MEFIENSHVIVLVTMSALKHVLVQMYNSYIRVQSKFQRNIYLLTVVWLSQPRTTSSRFPETECSGFKSSCRMSGCQAVVQTVSFQGSISSLRTTIPTEP